MRKIALTIMICALAGPVFAEMTLKVVTVNVWSGLTYHGALKSGTYESREERSFRYGLLVNELREIDADVISVNEANMLPGYAKKLARDLGYDYIYAVRFGGVRLGQAGFPINAREGDVILAKQYLNLAPAGSRELNRGYAGNFASFHLRDKRQVLAGRITVGERAVFLFSSNWTESEFASADQLQSLVDLFTGGQVDSQDLLARVTDAMRGHEIRAEEAKKTLTYIDEVAGDSPAILMGTLNALPASAEIKALLDAGFSDVWDKRKGAGYTWDGTRNTNIINYLYDPESPEPPRRDRVDYILHRGADMDTVSADIALDRATYKIHPSDHFAVVALISF